MNRQSCSKNPPEDNTDEEIEKKNNEEMENVQLNWDQEKKQEEEEPLADGRFVDFSKQLLVKDLEHVVKPDASRSNLLLRGDGLEELNRPGGSTEESNGGMEVEDSGEGSSSGTTQPNQDSQSASPNNRVIKIAIRRKPHENKPKKEE